MKYGIYRLFVLLDSPSTLLSFLESAPVVTISSSFLMLFHLNLANEESLADDQREGRQTHWVFGAPTLSLWNSLNKGGHTTNF